MRISTLLAAVPGLIAGALALLATPCAVALSLGDATPQSSLGQPLRVAVPIGSTGGQALTAACVRVIADAAGGSGPPQLLTGRVTIDRSTAGSQLVVTTVRPVNDPVVRLAVQAGCDGTTRRDYIVLLDPPSTGAAAWAHAPIAAVVARPVAPAPLSRHTKLATAAVTPAIAHLPATALDTPAQVPMPNVAAVEAPRPPAAVLSSPRGSSFIPEASAAGLPRASSAQGDLMPGDAEPQVAPWWPLAAALLVVAALARWLVPMRRRSAMEPPAWVAPTARTEPNPSVSGRPASKSFGKTGYFAAMTEPGPGFPRGASSAERAASKTEAARAKFQPVAGASTIEDRRFAEFDADMLEEQTIRAEWANAVNDGAIDIGSDSILKAIDDAEREIQGPPMHPKQVALDRSLDDELLPRKARG
jgi:hypothetical protein